jgi:hypothetical protein
MLTETTPTGQHPSVRHARNFAGPLLLAASLLWCAYWFLSTRGFWEDDAWIHLEFARSIAQGHGFAFNGRTVAGDTAPLWVLLLAATHALIRHWMAAGKLLTAIGAVFGLSGVFAFARRMARHLLTGPATQIFPAAMVLLVVVNPYTCYWIFSGMEPVAAAGVACWAVLAATRTQPTAVSFLTGCLLAGIGPLLRPEMFFLAVLLALPLYGQWRRIGAQPAIKLLCAAVGLALLTCPLLAWSCYAVHAFGHLLPNTNAAKRAGPDESVLRRLITIYAAGLPVILGGAVAGLLHLALYPSIAANSLRNAVPSALITPVRQSEGTHTEGARSPALPLDGWIFILWSVVCTMFYLANHTYVQTRYIFITAPGLSIVILGLAISLWPRSGRWIYVAAIAAGAGVSLAIVVPFLRNKSENCDAMRQMARFIHDRLPPNAPVAVYAIGQIAFESDHAIIDTGGITRPEAIPYLYAPVGSMVQWAKSEGAQYYIDGKPPLPDSVRVFTVQTPLIGWTFHISQYAENFPVSVWRLPARPQQPHLPAPQLSLQADAHIVESDLAP